MIMLEFYSLADHVVFPKYTLIISGGKRIEIGDQGVPQTVIMKIPAAVFGHFLAKVFAIAVHAVNEEQFCQQVKVFFDRLRVPRSAAGGQTKRNPIPVF